MEFLWMIDVNNLKLCKKLYMWIYARHYFQLQLILIHSRETGNSIKAAWLLQLLVVKA